MACTQLCQSATALLFLDTTHPRAHIPAANYATTLSIRASCKCLWSQCREAVYFALNTLLHTLFACKRMTHIEKLFDLFTCIIFIKYIQYLHYAHIVMGYTLEKWDLLLWENMGFIQMGRKHGLLATPT